VAAAGGKRGNGAAGVCLQVRGFIERWRDGICLQVKACHRNMRMTGKRVRVGTGAGGVGICHF
jgi:hypothetical protein